MAHHTESDSPGHITSARALVATWATLMVLTAITVGAITVDLGSQVNLVIAMVIATIKAAIVIGFFMHLVYDKRFNFSILAICVLCVVLLVSLVFLDAGQYQPDIERRHADALQASSS